MSQYKNTKNKYLALLEESLPNYFTQETIPQGEVIRAMKYSLDGGKRVRGTLCLAFYQLFGGANLEHAAPFAASVEMVHAYSLIHDDLPCMDDDKLRRGRPSCHVAFGESTALLAGDGLLTLAFEVLSQKEHQNNFTNNEILSCISILATSSGTKGMIGGQILDLANENKAVSPGELERTDMLKTGALITAAAVMGSILGGAEDKQLKAVEVFGKRIGLAFQVIDDILDTTSTTEKLGKPVDSDVKNKKNTYVSVYGLEKSKIMAENLTKEALEALESTGRESEFITFYTNELARRNF